MDDRRLDVSITVAAPLLAAAGLALAWMLARPTDAPAAKPAAVALEHCRRAAELLYEVSWAAACMKTTDESTDCTLPDAEAAKVNALLASEEARCMAVETQAVAPR
jgi:hypothetical protein